VIFIHNHPSGDPAPSREDINITERLVQAGDIVGIKVLDHIIIGENTYTSMMEKGYIK
jgi:DNA repair protein RadC